MPTREYAIDYFQVQVGPSPNGLNIASTIERVLRGEHDPVLQDIDKIIELRDLRPLREGVYRGVLARYRVDDLPHKGAPRSAEEELGLEDEEGLLEKNHFLYVASHRVLLFQMNRQGYNEKVFTRFFTHALGETCVAHPILQEDAMERLIRGDAHIRNVDLTVAQPRNPEVFQRDGAPVWTDAAFQAMAASGAYQARIVIRAKPRVRDEQRFLGGHVLGAIQQLMALREHGEGGLQRAKIGWEDEERAGVVDLLSDRVRDHIDVERFGRYPNSQGMWAGMDASWAANRATVEAVLGAPDVPQD